MTVLSKTAILEAQDLKFQDVEVPEWGGTVRVRTMSGAERDAMGAAMVDEGGKVDMHLYRVRLLAMCIVGEDNQRMFSDADVGALAQKSAVALDAVFQVADKLNSITAASVEAAKGN